jgi:hypothetical protein
MTKSKWPTEKMPWCALYIRHLHPISHFQRDCTSVTYILFPTSREKDFSLGTASERMPSFTLGEYFELLNFRCTSLRVMDVTGAPLWCGALPKTLFKVQMRGYDVKVRRGSVSNCNILIMDRFIVSSRKVVQVICNEAPTDNIHRLCQIGSRKHI